MGRNTSNNQNLNEYNKVFEKLCSDGDNLDIYDMVAYGIYKKSKRTFITNHKSQKGKSPTPNEIKNYVSSAEAHLDNYKLQAEKMVEELFNNIMLDKLPEIENQLLKKIVKPSFWKNVFTNIFASFLWAIFLVIMYFIIFGYSLEQIGQKYFSKQNNIEIDTTIKK